LRIGTVREKLSSCLRRRERQNDWRLINTFGRTTIMGSVEVELAGADVEDVKDVIVETQGVNEAMIRETITLLLRWWILLLLLLLREIVLAVLELGLLLREARSLRGVGTNTRILLSVGLVMYYRSKQIFSCKAS
jgi:hypothetical protein